MKAGGKGRTRQKNSSHKESPIKTNQKIKQRAVPKSEMGLNVDKTVNYTTLYSISEEREINIKFSKSFQESQSRDYNKLFIEKCKQCSFICDFSSTSIDQKSKSTKTQLIKQLTSAFALPNVIRSITQETMNSFYKMLSVNLFRPLPKMKKFTVIDTHDVLYDSAWPHLSILYQALQASFNIKYAQNISPQFIYCFIGNSVSPDDRERVIVRDILHSMYTKFMNLRSIVREKIADQFSNGVYSAELLEFLISVVSGFNSPLNPEHVTFFRNSVLPLHTSNDFAFFSSQVKHLILAYIQKSGFLLDYAVEYLLLHWPKCNRQKQALFLKEIEELLITYEIHISQQMAIKAFGKIGEMANNMNSDVAFVAFRILTNSNLSFSLKTYANAVFPLLIPPLYRSTRAHWDDCIRDNAFVTLQTLSEIEKSAFSHENDQMKNEESQKLAAFNAKKSNWSKIYDMAKSNSKYVKPIDFTDLKQDYDYKEKTKIVI